MTKLINALMRTFAVSDEPSVHFHQSTAASLPEVCHDRTCQRPQLRVR